MFQPGRTSPCNVELRPFGPHLAGNEVEAEMRGIGGRHIGLHEVVVGGGRLDPAVEELGLRAEFELPRVGGWDHAVVEGRAVLKP